VDRVRQVCLHRTKKFTRLAPDELNLPTKMYASSPKRLKNYARRVKWYSYLNLIMCQNMHVSLLTFLIILTMTASFRLRVLDAATYSVIGKGSHHNWPNLGSENRHAVFEYICDIPNISV
jgi:hypothetical protein